MNRHSYFLILVVFPLFILLSYCLLFLQAQELMQLTILESETEKKKNPEYFLSNKTNADHVT